MCSARLLGYTLTLLLSSACATPTHAPRAANGNAVTPSGREIPKPMAEKADLREQQARSK